MYRPSAEILTRWNRGGSPVCAEALDIIGGDVCASSMRAIFPNTGVHNNTNRASLSVGKPYYEKCVRTLLPSAVDDSEMMVATRRVAVHLHSQWRIGDALSTLTNFSNRG